MEQVQDRDRAIATLRHARNRAALAIALADLADLWDVETVTDYLTRLADLAVRCGLDYLLREAADDGRLKEFSRDGLVVLALGKHGGQELNYSSDIDFVIYYTANALPLVDGQDARKFYIKLVQDLTALLQNVTADGFVFRVDLRLRPDPGATPVTITVDAALSYYESMGQNWERAVYIKARPIAGDMAAGAKFLADLQPYIWRRYFDFAAIEDVHSMKRQMHAVRGHAEIAAEGHNLKLGRGGIREIEFFVQTQQLIAGGRDPDLRGHRTVEMLHMLAQKQWIDTATAEKLTASYYYLRRMEHRLQMRLDEQTQTLPKDDAGFAGFARFAGYERAQDFAAELTSHLSGVTGEYARLFEQAESLSGDAGNLVFTGGEDDPETLETLSNMGFKRPADISAIIRGWHAGRMAATRSEGHAKSSPVCSRSCWPNWRKRARPMTVSCALTNSSPRCPPVCRFSHCFNPTRMCSICWSISSIQRRAWRPCSRLMPSWSMHWCRGISLKTCRKICRFRKRYGWLASPCARSAISRRHTQFGRSGNGHASWGGL